MTTNTSTPDLATILQTLASLNQGHQAQDQLQNPQTNINTSAWSTTSNQNHNYNELSEHFQNSQNTSYQRQAAVSHPQHTGKQSQTIDPTTIIDWSVGLRCVMRTVSKHDQLLGEIRKVRIPSFNADIRTHSKNFESR